jgi:hypothetical protein
MKLLDVQCIFHEASQPGGQLFGEQWRRAALINQDYVLVAMILCLDLAWGMRVEEGLPYDCEDEVETMWPRNKRLQTLKSSYDIWCKSSTISALAAKAAEALRVMLKDLESTDSAEAVPTILVSNPTIVSGTPLLVVSPPLMILILFSPDATPAPQLPAYSDQAYLGASNKLDFSAQYFVGSSATDFLTGTIDTEMNFDWVSSDPSKVFQ